MRVLLWGAFVALCFSVQIRAQSAWTPLPPSTGGVDERVIWQTGADGTLYGTVGEGRTLVRSLDGGQTGEAVVRARGRFNGLRAFGSTVFAWDIEESFVDGRVLVSRDGGATWGGGGRIADAFLYDFDVLGDTLVAAANPATSSGAARVFWSVDGGASWTPSVVIDLQFDPNQISCYTRSLYVFEGRFHAVTGCGLYRATRGAEDWQAVYEGALTDAGLPLELWDSATGDGAAYVSPSGFSASFWSDVFAQVDGGPWVRFNIAQKLGVSNPRLDDNSLLSHGRTVAVLLEDASVAPNPGVAYSTDRGETWALLNDGLPTMPDGDYALGGAFEVDGRFYLSAFDGAAFRQFVLDARQPVASENDAVPAADEGLRTWPNPVRDALNVAAPSLSDTPVRVLDLLGRTRAEATARASSVQLDLSMLPSGVYIVEVDGTQGRQTARVTVVR